LSRLAKILIMTIRLIALLSIILGIILYLGKTENPQNYIASHFAFGFLLAAAVFILGVIALVQKIVPLGVLGLLAAVALPLTGFRQISTLGPNMGIPQILHIVVVFAAIGIAEASAAKIQRASV
jgi:di/tricarboxylate transporter